MKNAVFIFLFLFPHSTWHPSLPKLIVWNVGQGQWVTYKSDPYCIHIDFGGEYSPIEKVYNECSKLKNVLLLSHDDKDHLSFYWSLKRSLRSVCMLHHPKIYNKLKYFINLTGISQCLSLSIVKVQTLLKEITYQQPSLKFNKNSYSSIYLAQGKHRVALLPGDSTDKQENIWADKITTAVHFLILGHHGSKTSTSDVLLQHLPHLKLAIVSARKKKYGHPHPTVVERLRKGRIPLLETEKWGNIHIEI